MTATAARITATIRHLDTHHTGWVSLAALRDALADVDRADLDAELRQLTRNRRVNPVPQANQKILTPAERDAALKIGGESCHLISLG